MGYRVQTIKTYALTTALAEIVAPSTAKFSEYIVVESSGNAINIAHEEDGDLFPLSEARGTMPFNITERNATGGVEKSLFWAATAASTGTLTIMFLQN